MSPSGAEVLRQIKSRIDQVDPAAARDQAAHGAVLVDIREIEEWSAGHIPGARHVPKSYLETRIEGAAPDRTVPVILYCASGNRSAWGARTLIEDLGYEHVSSMTGGFTLWKDRGYEVEIPRTMTPEQRDRYSRHLLLPEVGMEGTAEAARREGAAARRRRSRLARRAVSRRGRRGHARDRRRRRGRRLEPAAPGDPHDPDRVGMPKVDSAEGDDPRALNPDVKVEKHKLRIGAGEHHGRAAELRHRRRRLDLPDPVPAERRLGAPLVPGRSAAILGFDGQLSVFKPYEGPCYRCLFENAAAGHATEPSTGKGHYVLLGGGVLNRQR